MDDAINVVIADCVDETLFALLNAIDQGVLRLKFVSGTGDVVDLEQDGQAELGGWFVGDDGWRALYAEEPYADDAADERND